MGVQFSIRGEGYDVDDPRSYVDLSNVNARDMFERLGLSIFAGQAWGEMRARELADLCRQELTPKKRCQDVGLTAYEDGRVHFAGRPAGRINMRIQELLALCEMAGDLGLITWG